MEAGFNTLADLIRETNTEFTSTRTELSSRMDHVREELSETRRGGV